MSDYQLKKGRLGEKVIGVYKKVEDNFVDTFLEKDESGDGTPRLRTGKIGKAVVEGYHGVEDTVVGAYKKVENAFVNAFLEKKEEPAETKEENRASENGLRQHLRD